MQVFLDECLHELKVLEYDQIDVSEGTDVNKTNASKECDICHYWYFFNKEFRFELYVSNDCHYLMEKAINFNDAAIVSVKGSYYRIHYWYISKNDAIRIIKNSDLNLKIGL